MIKNLTVMAVAEKDKGLLRYTIESVKKYTPNLHEIIICDNGKNKKVLEPYREDPMVNIISNSPNLVGGSNRHGSGMNRIFPLIKTEFVAHIESDCVVLSEDWCKFDMNKYKIVTPFKRMAENKKWPYICFMLMRTEDIRKDGIDLRPGTDASRSNRAYMVNEDAGWRIMTRVKDSDVLWLGANHCKTGNGKYFDTRFSYKSFEIYRDDDESKVIAAHFYRGSAIERRGNIKGLSPKLQLRAWKARVEELLEL